MIVFDDFIPVYQLAVVQLFIQSQTYPKIMITMLITTSNLMSVSINMSLMEFQTSQNKDCFQHYKQQIIQASLESDNLSRKVYSYILLHQGVPQFNISFPLITKISGYENSANQWFNGFINTKIIQQYNWNNERKVKQLVSLNIRRQSKQIPKLKNLPFKGQFLNLSSMLHSPNNCTNRPKFLLFISVLLYLRNMGNQCLERIAMDVRTHQNVLFSSREIDCEMAVFLKYAEANEVSTSHIKMISLTSKAVGLSGIRTLVRFDLRGTVKLNLYNNNFGPYAMKELAKGIFTNLKSIFLRTNKIGSLGLRFLSTGSFSSLEIINLWENEIGSEGMKYLSQGQFKNLDTLQLKQNKIDSEGIKYLSSGVFYRLRVINLSQNRIKSECLKHILNGSLCKLQKIQLHQSQIFQKTIAIVERFTFARVQTHPRKTGLKWYK